MTVRIEAASSEVPVTPSADNIFGHDGYSDEELRAGGSTLAAPLQAVCGRGRDKLLQYSGMCGGALFVLVPNSELIHSAFRTFTGATVGYQCC